MNVVTKDSRLKRLLAVGLFPRDLPPPFVSGDLALRRNFLLKNWPAASLKTFSSQPETYSIPRFGKARRRFSIVNPINHLKISKLIADDWSEIRRFLKTSSISEFKPVFNMMGERTFFDIDFDLIELRSAELLSKYRSVLKTDISRYYHTIYTHSIPWALYQKDYCKKHHRTAAFKKTLGDRLDVAVRQCQQDQTVGLPVGPDTSRVLGEIIGVGIERELAKLVKPLSEKALRYVDDIQIGFDERDSVDGILSSITKSISHFELDINIEKTEVLGVGELIAPEWTAALRHFSVSRRRTRQQADIEHFFKTALHFADTNPKDHVLTYAVKRSRSFLISDEVFPYYVTLLLRIARRDTSCLPTVSQVLIESNYRKRSIDLRLVKKFVLDMVRYNAPIHNYFEVSWSLFLSKALKITLKKGDLAEVFKAESSVCALLVMDLHSRGLISGGIDLSNWLASYNSDGLSSSMWLMVYESTLKNWIPAATPCFVLSHSLFGPMLAKKISFYDANKNVYTTQRELRLLRRRTYLSKRVFGNIDTYF